MATYNVMLNMLVKIFGKNEQKHGSHNILYRNKGYYVLDNSKKIYLLDYIQSPDLNKSNRKILGIWEYRIIR